MDNFFSASYIIGQQEEARQYLYLKVTDQFWESWKSSSINIIYSYNQCLFAWIIFNRCYNSVPVSTSLTGKTQF